MARGLCFVSFFAWGSKSQALSFNRLNAQQLGEQVSFVGLATMGSTMWTSQKVWKAKKKNKGKKRKDWWAAVKDYHNQGGTDGQDQRWPTDPDHNKLHGGDGAAWMELLPLLLLSTKALCRQSNGI